MRSVPHAYIEVDCLDDTGSSFMLLYANHALQIGIDGSNYQGTTRMCIANGTFMDLHIAHLDVRWVQMDRTPITQWMRIVVNFSVDYNSLVDPVTPLSGPSLRTACYQGTAPSVMFGAFDPLRPAISPLYFGTTYGGMIDLLPTAGRTIRSWGAP